MIDNRTAATLLLLAVLVTSVVVASLTSNSREKEQIRELQDSVSTLERLHEIQRVGWIEQLVVAQEAMDTLEAVREREAAARDAAERRSRLAERRASELRSAVDSMRADSATTVEQISDGYEAIIAQKDTVIAQQKTIVERLSIQLQTTDSALISVREGLVRANLRVANLETEMRLKDEIIERQNALIHKPLFGLIPSGLKGDVVMLLAGYVGGKGLEALAN